MNNNTMLKMKKLKGFMDNCNKREEIKRGCSNKKGFLCIYIWKVMLRVFFDSTARSMKMKCGRITIPFVEHCCW